MVAFANPVVGLIRPPGSPLIVGSFRVTCSFQCHEARTPPTQGIDVGDGTIGKLVVAMGPGTISFIKPGKVGSSASIDASIIRVKHPSGHESGSAHLKIKAGLAVGQVVAEGDQLGTIDKIGASAAHHHGGMKDPNGVEIDWWPLLRQNGATEDDMLQGTNPRPVDNKKVSTTGTGVAFRSSPFVKADNVLVRLPIGTELHLDYIVDGTAVGSAADKRWYGAWATTPNGIEFGYISATVASVPQPIEQSGHTDQELADAAAAGRTGGIRDATANAGATK